MSNIEEIKVEYKKLPPEFKIKFLEALRSGEYKQAQETLCRRINMDGEPVQYGYCCIGVAGRVAGMVPEDLIDHCVFIPREIYDKSLGTYPREFLKRHGIPDALIGGSKENWTVNRLTEMNDSLLKTFPEIADWVEKNL